MADALSIAQSGLAAQGQRIAATANNIANAATVGSVPTQGAPASSVYKPLSVSYMALGTGGVRADVRENAQGYTPVFDPSSAYANAQGLIAAPDVDLAQESVNILEIKTIYKANLSVIRTQDDMLRDLLNTIA